MNKKLYLFILLVLPLLVLSGCGGDDGLADGESSTTETDQDDDNTTSTIDDNYVYQLPVIFHVFYTDLTTTKQEITVSRLTTLLQYVNEIYEGGIYGTSEDANLEFVMAQYDESGNKLSTPGVEYVEWNGDFPIDENAFMSDNTGKYVGYIWDPNEYINVMIYPFKENDDGSITLGISHMPFTTEGDEQLDGLSVTTSQTIKKSQLRFAYCSSINSDYVGQSSSGGYYQSDRYVNSDHSASYYYATDVVVTLSHELGHYLGLFHDFTETITDGNAVTVDSCGDTDYCEDTPSYNRAEYIEYLNYYIQNNSSKGYSIQDLVLRKGCDSTEFNSVNIMDYAYSYGYQISAEQKARIRHVLYYSPLIPGPKKSSTTSSSRAGREATTVNLRPVIIK